MPPESDKIAPPKIFVTFVHGYQNLEYEVPRDDLPALWCIEGDQATVIRAPFLRNVADFCATYRDMIQGVGPLPGVEDFRRLPRFGLSGSSITRDYLYAGSSNAVYRFRTSDGGLETIISNPMMSDLHGIWADDEQIITVLTGRDTVVFSDPDGAIIDHFTIDRRLNVFKEPKLEETDWRFLTKGFRGPSGCWHFNYVQKLDGQIWLTSRNAAGFVVVDLKRRAASLRLINHKTPVLLHDGWRSEGKHYFTSIDGKIIIAEESRAGEVVPGAEVDVGSLYHRDLVSQEIALKQTEYGREPNWCRGIAKWGDVMYVTIDGRYDDDLSFGLLAIDREGRVHGERRLKWSDVGDETEIRHVTGFDVQVWPPPPRGN